MSYAEGLKKRLDVNPKEGVEKYGAEAHFADPVNKKYPLDTAEHVRAAARYWGMPKNNDKYQGEGKAEISARIDNAKAKFNIK